ncbi:hypothetical protein [Paraburkholderia acidicola]|nr:hypothetical protein [Paraburkholderia acidicola]
MRRSIVGLFIVSLLTLQGCATSWQTFLAGSAVGAVAVVSGIACTVTCH